MTPEELLLYFLHRAVITPCEYLLVMTEMKEGKASV